MKIMEWDLESGEKMKSLDGHNGDVAALSLKPGSYGEDNPDGAVFVTGSVDRTIRLWDLRADQCQQVNVDCNCICSLKYFFYFRYSGVTKPT